MSSWLPLAAYIRPDLSYDLGLQDDAGEKVEHCNDDDHKTLDVFSFGHDHNSGNRGPETPLGLRWFTF